MTDTVEINLKKWLNHSRKRARQKFISICLEAHQNLVRLSPVDTGFFRSQWAFSINDEPPRQHVDPPEDGGAVPPPDVASITAAGLGDRVFIFNPTRYARALENGHSAQAPNGMVKLVMLDLKAAYGSGT